MKVGSLFSGIGGMDLGLERSGMEIVWQVEIDDWCRRVLARHFPNAVRYGDVRGCHGAHLAKSSRTRNWRLPVRQRQPRSRASNAHRRSQTLAPVDLICGGFPCQPVSHAGRRMGAEDERWLWPEFARIIREVRPRWVLVENVPGLLSIEDGRLFGGVLRDLAESGYDAQWDCISAAALGAPHIRDRVFIVGYAQHTRRDATKVSSSTPQGSDGSEAGAEQASKPTRPSEQRGDVADAANDGSSRGGRTRSRRAGLEDFRPEVFVRLPDGTERPIRESDWTNQWAVEPNVGRVAHGIPARVDRLTGLGNAVVPQVAEYIGRLIMEADK